MESEPWAAEVAMAIQTESDSHRNCVQDCKDDRAARESITLNMQDERDNGSTANRFWYCLLAAVFLSTFADRLILIQLLALVVLSGPFGETLGLSSAALILPAVMVSVLAGILIDRHRRTSILITTLAVRALIMVALAAAMPFLFESGDGTINILIVVVLLCTCSAFFSVGRTALIKSISTFSVAPNTAPVRDVLQKNNGQALSACTAATVFSSLAALELMARIPAPASMFICASLYVASALLISLIPRQIGLPLCSVGAPGHEVVASNRSLRAYLKTHRKPLQLFRIAIIVCAISVTFYATLVTLGVQNHHLSAPILHELLAFLGLGLALGGLFAPSALKIMRPIELLAACTVVFAFLCVVCSLATTLMAAKILVVLMGIVNAAALTTLDTILESTFPNQFLGRVLGIRESLVMLALLCSTVYLERVIQSISVMPLLRILSLSSLFIAAALFVVWEELAYFAIRLLIKIVMRIGFSLKVYAHNDDGRNDAGMSQKRHNLHNGERAPVILAGNHTGWLDGIIIGSAFKRKVRFLIMDRAFSWPLVGWLLSRLGGIPVKPGRGTDAIDTAVRCLKKGESVCIFPEGKLTHDGSMGKFHNGVARLQRQSGCKIVPFAIEGGFEAWGFASKMPRFHPIKVKLGPPIEAKQMSPAEITAHVETAVRALKESLQSKQTT